MAAIVPSADPSATSPFDALRQVGDDGQEFWSARDLQPALGYSQWRQFEDAVERARVACGNSGHDPAHHFAVDRKVTEGGRWGAQSLNDYSLSRYAAYLVAMNGDPRKVAIADAQTYFAAKTREAEIREAPDELELAERYVVAIKEKRAALARAAEAERERDALAPAAHSWEVLASANQDFSVRQAAHILNRDSAIETGERRLFAQLRARRMVDSRDRPYQRHAAHLRLRPRTYTDPQSGEEMAAAPQVRVTVQGLMYLHRQMGGSGDVGQHIAAHQELAAIGGSGTAA